MNKTACCILYPILVCHCRRIRSLNLMTCRQTLGYVGVFGAFLYLYGSSVFQTVHKGRHWGPGILHVWAFFSDVRKTACVSPKEDANEKVTPPGKKLFRTHLRFAEYGGADALSPHILQGLDIRLYRFCVRKSRPSGEGRNASAMFCITELCGRYSVLLGSSRFLELHFVQYKERRDQKRRAGGEADPGRFGKAHDEIAHGADRRNQRRVGQLRLYMADVLAGRAGGGEDRRVGNFRAGFRPAFLFRRARSRPDDRRRAGRRFAGP